uniref:Uncharacterized protein n=1 Tax=viral metagenome TaxID=1070528 RepID=A0A6H1ZBY0_9ZZZZ
MNLLQLRTKLRELSGRFDLVNDDFSDNGADFFINEGQKFLDRLDETQKSWASCFRFAEVEGFSVQFPYCRAIKEVWAASTTERWQLEKKNLQDLIAEYLTELPGQRSVGEPEYYSPGITRYIPENATADTFESYIGWVDVPAGGAHEYNTILLNIPTSAKIVLEIKGLFYTMQLVNDTDENHWSVNHPLLLIMAAQRQMEVVNRNTQGVNDWSSAISTESKQLGMDLVEELIAEVNQMGG